MAYILLGLLSLVLQCAEVQCVGFGLVLWGFQLLLFACFFMELPVVFQHSHCAGGDDLEPERLICSPGF